MVNLPLRGMNIHKKGRYVLVLEKKLKNAAIMDSVISSG